jgi:hypothetical protein
MKLTIDDLLNSLQNVNEVVEDNEKKNSLPNNSDTWSRIGSRDSFSELGLDKTALEGFLEEWISENPYDNI